MLFKFWECFTIEVLAYPDLHMLKNVSLKFFSIYVLINNNK